MPGVFGGHLLLPESSPWWPVVAPWQRWDVLWYQHIATNGYGYRGPEAAFSPLFPALEHVLGMSLGNFALAGLIISTAAFVVALLAVDALVKRDFGADVGRRATLYLAVSPTAFFFLAGYPEGLFLALGAASMLAARRGHLLIAGSLVGAAILCRNQGVFFLAPLAVEAALRARAGWQRAVQGGLAFLIPVGIYGHYYAWIKSLGFSGGVLEIQQVYWRSDFGRPLEALVGSVQVIGTSLIDRPSELLNLAAALALAVSIPVMLGLRFPLSYTAYAGASLFGMTWRYSAYTPLMSDDRYLAVVFPFFVVLAIAAKRAWVGALVLTFSLPLLALLFIRFSQSEFVG